MKTIKTYPEGLEILYAIDDRGHFMNVPTEKYKRVYVIRNHKINTIRAYHYHNREELFLFSIKGSWKISYYDKKDNRKEEVISEGYGLVIPKEHGNGHINLTKDAVLLCCGTLSLKELKNEERKEPWDKFGGKEWEIQKK